MKKIEIEHEIRIIFNIQRKVINGINEVDNIKLQIGNKVEKLKPFFARGSFESL